MMGHVSQERGIKITKEILDNGLKQVQTKIKVVQLRKGQ
jgi:hypothetical protein